MIALFPQMWNSAVMASDYTSDRTYWTGRKRGEHLEVVLMKSNGSGGYEAVETYGYYERHGAAVAAAAQLAYFQGKRDAAIELRARVHEALESVNLGPVMMESPEELAEE